MSTKVNGQQAMLSLAIQIASMAHADDADKGGNAYILHPLRVMFGLNSKDPELMQQAILHDVIEDCIRFLLTFCYLRMGEDDVTSRVNHIMINATNEEKVNYALDSLRRIGFSERVITGLKNMTKLDSDVGEAGYFAYIERMLNNYDSIRLKMSDITDNSDLNRLKGFSPKDAERTVKYQKAYRMLEQARKKFETQY